MRRPTGRSGASEAWPAGGESEGGLLEELGKGETWCLKILSSCLGTECERRLKKSLSRFLGVLSLVEGDG